MAVPRVRAGFNVVPVNADGGGPEKAHDLGLLHFHVQQPNLGRARSLSGYAPREFKSRRTVRATLERQDFHDHGIDRSAVRVSHSRAARTLRRWPSRSLSFAKTPRWPSR